MNWQPTFWFSLLFKLDEMAILSKVYVLDNFKLQNSLKLSFTNIRGFPSNFVGCESFLESNFPDIFALCETNVEDSINSINFSLRGYFPLTQTDYYSYTWFCSLCIKGNWFCTWLISKKLRVFLHSYLAGVLLPFLVLITVFLCPWFLMLFHLTLMKSSQSIHLLIYLSLETLESIISTG